MSRVRSEEPGGGRPSGLPTERKPGYATRPNRN